MAIPHIIFKQLAKKRLVGKEGKEKTREIRKLLVEMPGYKTGPYGEIRKWLHEQIQETRQRTQVKAKTFFDVKRQGDAQIVLLGAPNIGKSSLLKKLSSIQIKVANYAFTTLKPIPAIVDFGGALVQIVEIPGLLARSDAASARRAGASEGKGGGPLRQGFSEASKAMLSAARNANYLVLMTSIDTPVEKTEAVYKEMGQFNLPAPTFLICNKTDLSDAQEKLMQLGKVFPDVEIVAISTENNEGIETLKNHLWQHLELIRVFLKNRSGEIEKRPVVVPTGSTIKDVLQDLPPNISEQFHFGKVWGPSVKFAGQQVGEKHILYDGDVLEIH